MRIAALTLILLFTSCAVQAQDKAASPVLVDTSKSCAYESGKWTYAYVICAKGTKSERRLGELSYDGKPIPGAAEFDRIKTPWGVMQYFGELSRQAWNSGWLLKATYDTPIDEKKGRLLPEPVNSAAKGDVPDAGAKPHAGEDEAIAKLGKERAEKLKEDLPGFVLELRYVGEQDKPFYGMTVSVKPMLRDGVRTFWEEAIIDPATAKKIVESLAESGVLGRAEDTSMRRKERPEPAGPCYVMSISGAGMTFEADLGWGKPLALELFRLRGLLGGEAGRKMDILLVRLSGFIKEWTGEPYAPPK